MRKIDILLFLFLITVGSFIRFYNVDHVLPYGWDQTRDAFQVKSILAGNFTLEGPRTGVGHFHLGPLWFYLLVPFFYFTNLDPIASQHLNILICTITFGVLFYVTKKLFSPRLALLILGMYAFNNYMINLNIVPWNVSLMPLLSILIFYFTYKTFQEKKFMWSIALFTSCGIAFHAHFSAIVFPLMLSILWLLNKDKREIFLLLIKSLPFYLVWFIPIIFAYITTNYSDYHRMQDFLKNYFVGFHLKFLLHRLPDFFVQFRLLLTLPIFVGYLILAGNFLLYFKTSKTHKLYLKIFFSWMLSFILIFGAYGGQISEYYFLFTLPVVYYSFLVLLQRLFSIQNKMIPSLLLLCFISYYMYQNIQTYTDHKEKKGLAEQRESVRERIKKGKKIPYKDGTIEHYFYLLYKN